MEYEVKSPLFKNASVRKDFLKLVIEAFEGAQGHAELICLYEQWEPTFFKMQASAEDDHDYMVWTIIQGRYRACHERIEESREWVYKLITEFQERYEQCLSTQH